MNDSALIDQTPADPREVVRVICRTKQCLPVLERGSWQWVWFSDDWRRCQVKRRLPGNVYKASLLPTVVGCRDIVICSNNYGGPQS